MSLDLAQLDASIRALAFAMAQGGRVDGEAVLGAAASDRFPAGVLDPVRTVESESALRAEVLSKRGVDQVALMRLRPNDRYLAEVSVAAETAVRTSQAPVRAMGAFVDLRV